MSLVPVNLEMLCAVWTEQEAEMTQWGIPVGASILYCNFSNYLWKRFVDKEQVERPGKAYTSSERDRLFLSLEELALQSFEKEKKVIETSTVEDIFGSSAFAILRDSCFLLLQRINSQYKFSHVTFQEYFAGRALARQFLCGSRDKVADFLKQRMYMPRYKHTLSFMSGEIVKGMPNEVNSATSSKEVVPIRALLQLTATLPEEILGRVPCRF